jgi:P4 family phage/plasmid primase-like protien
MLTWDKEVKANVQRVVETMHYPHLPFTVAQMTRQNGHVTSCQHYHCPLDEHVERMERYGLEAFEAYVAVCGSTTEHMRLSDMTESWAVAADFDHGLAELCQPGQPLAPTVVIETSPGRFRCVWQFDTPVLSERLGRLAKAIASRLNADMSYARSNQLVRLPRFINQKRGCRVLLRDDLSTGTIYKADFLWTACDGDLYEASVMQASPKMNHTHRSPMRDKPETTLKHARAAALHLASQGHANHYDTWWSVLANLTPLGAEGLAIADDFSRASASYDRVGVETKWTQLLKSSTGALSTLFAVAHKEGWTNPGWADAEGTAEPARAVTDREFGARIAEKMSSTVVALEPETASRAGALFLQWDDRTYRLLAPREKRAAVAQAAQQVITEARQSGSSEAGWTNHEKKLGNNKNLEEVCEHVAEALVGMCEARIVGEYPYLPVANGVLNLLTRQLVPEKYQPIAQTAATVSYDPNAKAEVFLRFLNEVLLHDQEMVAYMLRVLGYALLGNPLEQVMFILLGPSGNGKSTLMAVILAMLGSLGGRLKTETLMQKSHVNDGASPALFKIKGTRAVVVAEPNRNHKLDTSLLKQITGEKAIYLRGLYSGGGEVRIECVIFMTANFMPFAEAQDAGMWRRIRVIPFERQFSPEEINPHMTEELLAEAPGILNLLLAGLADYQAQGLNPPEKALNATSALKQDADSFSVFVGECCVLSHGKPTELKALWAAYQVWSKGNPKFPTMSKREFTQRLQDRFERKMRGHLPIFVGVSLISE